MLISSMWGFWPELYQQVLYIVHIPLHMSPKGNHSL